MFALDVVVVGQGQLIGGGAWGHNDPFLGRGGESTGLALLYAVRI